MGEFYTVSVILAGIIVFAVLLLPAILILKRPSSNHKVKLTIYVFVLIWIARFFVGLADNLQPGGDLTAGEAFFDSIIHALQTFSMDEDYTSYTVLGKELLLSAGFPVWSAVYGIVISVLNVCAPILGGALLLEVLTNAFPRIKIALAPFRHKFVFSDLNIEAVTLAEDIIRDDHYKLCYPAGVLNTEQQEKRKKKNDADGNGETKNQMSRKRSGIKPMIIFTDAYVEEGSESQAELLGRAKAIGAVCIRTDLKHLPLSRSRTVDYFLLDKDSRGNISALSHLLTPVKQDKNGKSAANERYLWPRSIRVKKDGAVSEEPAARIFFFRQNAMEASMVQHLREKNKEAADRVIIRLIEDYRNAAVNLMYQVPLFLPLLRTQADEASAGVAGKNNTAGSHPDNIEAGTKVPTEEKALAVTIIGSGSIAEEVFKAVYWCGQMLGVRLQVRVLSKDVQHFRQRIEEGCPELLESCRAGSELLRIYPDRPGIYNPPYADVSFFGVRDAQNLANYPAEILEHTDYFVVALGDDERNIEVTDKLRLHLAKKLEDRGGTHPVIAPAVYDQAMAQAVQSCSHEPDEAFEPYITPFAGLKERFSCANVFMNDFTANALSTAKLYSKKEQDKVFKDEYSYWANIVRSVHAPYKLFSVGRILAVDPHPDARERFLVDRVVPAEGQVISGEERQRLGWLEHRRWNAFIRSQGFTNPSAGQYETYYNLYGTHKCIALKFHNCLVETDAFTEGRELPTAQEFAAGDYDPAKYDALDHISMSAYEKDCRRRGDELSGANRSPDEPDPLRATDYKQWDYCDYDDAFQALLRRRSE